MASPNPPTEPNPSLTAAELRRRLLASTPPPVAANAAAEGSEPASNGSGKPAWGSSQDLLARLRMPGGKTGSDAVPLQTVRKPAPQPQATPNIEPPLPMPIRPSVTRRTPAPVGRMHGLDPVSAITGALNALNGINDSHGRMPVDDSPMAEIQRLRHENKELRHLLDEMKHLLQEASELEQQFDGKQKEFQTTLAEKESQVEELSAQLGAIEEQIAKGELAPPPPIPKTRSELEEWGDELEKESSKLAQDRKKMDEERKQLREDEEGLENQMREMEVSMARERALLARQETELKRLNAEIQHELEILQRGDTGLREQMVKFQRRAQEVMTKPSGGSGTNGRR